MKLKRLITPSCLDTLTQPTKRNKSSIFTVSSDQQDDLKYADGFYIENDDTESYNRPSLTSFLFSKHVSDSNDGVFCVPCEESAGTASINVDLHTGVLFYTGERHYNKYNSLHQERPLRITSILNHLSAIPNLKNRCTIFDDDVPQSHEIKSFLNDEDYLRAHLPGYMQRLDILSTCNCQKRLDRESEQFTSIFFTESSVTEAKNAAMTLCRLVSDVVKGDLDNGFAVIRPPGHHAEPGVAGGFCIINNVAVAAAYAKAKLGVKKILIVDWDVHHGNGTQKIFLHDPNVLYFSVHRYQNGNYYPHLQSGGPSTVGVGDGVGKTVNVGWNKKGMGDEEYLAVWKAILMPIANEFEPDLVLVSAGFDAAIGDVGECNVTPECFGELTKHLLTLADAKVVCTLEGGYLRSVLGKCVEQVVNSLLGGAGESYLDSSGLSNDLETIDNSAANSIRKTISAHEKHWSCFKSNST